MLYVWLFAASVFVAGCLVLFLLGREAYRRLRTMTSTAAETSARIAAAAEALERITPHERQ